MSGDAGSGIEISALPEMSPRSLEGRRAVETLEKEMSWTSVSQYMRPLAAASGSCAPKPGSPAVTLAMVDEEMRVARQRQWDLVCNQLRTPDMEQFKETFGDRCRGDDWPPLYRPGDVMMRLNRMLKKRFCWTMTLVRQWWEPILHYSPMKRLLNWADDVR